MTGTPAYEWPTTTAGDPSPASAVRIAAASDGHVRNGSVMFNYYHDDLAEFPEAEALGRRLYAQAGIGPADVDAAEEEAAEQEEGDEGQVLVDDDLRRDPAAVSIR